MGEVLRAIMLLIRSESLHACVRKQFIAQIDLAFSNFLPLALTYGLVWECGTPGAGPKCFLASLSLEALKRRVLVPIKIKS